MNQLNSKIERISLSTLIIGVDIAKNVQVARAIDYRGIELAKTISFENNKQGFISFFKWIDKIMLTADKKDCLIGMEPTGHYWFNLGDYINKLDKRYGLVLVQPNHVKKTKELDDNNPTKNDKKDALTIAKLIKDGRYVTPIVHDEISAELRTEINLREDIIKQMGRINCKINRWIDIYFPEFKEVFKDLTCTSALLILKHAPFPKDIVKLDEKEIVQVWRTKVKSGIGIKKATILKAAALDSVGRDFGLFSSKDEICWLVEDYEQLEKRLKIIEASISNLLKQIPYGNKFTEIKGLGEVTVACILSETTDLTKYSHGKQLEKLAGLNLKENSSGTHKGKTTICKRGRKRLRAFLFRAILPLVCQNPEFKLLHEYYTTRKDNPLKGKQSLIALCCKLLRILHGMAMNNSNYNSEEILKGIDLSTTAKAAA